MKPVEIGNSSRRSERGTSSVSHIFLQEYFTQRIFHLWIFFTFLAIAGSESGEGSSSSSSSSSALTSADEVVGAAEARGPIECSFPSRWIGNWFQSGITHPIDISSTSISTKGRCLEVDGEKYLVYQRTSNCYRCLVFSEKHTNVLQYKETFCIHSRRSLRSICSQISGDANLYAMFRLNAQPIDCPLQGPFTFSYDRGYGECRYPESNLDSCTQPSRLLFNYQACPDVPKTESVEEELQCLAAWKEGSYRYFLGLIQDRHHHPSSYEERFRCFAYEAITTNSNIRRGEHHNSHNHNQYPQSLALGRSRPKPVHAIGMITSSSSSSMNNLNNSFNQQPHHDHHHLLSPPSSSEVVYRVEQSGDATCNGLSTMEGSRTMFLRKGQESKGENCQFPSWVRTHPQWHTLDQSSIYEFDGDQFRVTNYSEQLINANGPDSLAVSGSCMKLLEDEPGYRAVLVLHARAGCKIGYQCMVLQKRDADILEVQFGEWSRKHEEACSFYFDPYSQPYITLISSTPKTTQCPTLGEFSLQLPREQWRMMSGSGGLFQHDTICTTNGTLRMGCSSLDSMQLEISTQCREADPSETRIPSTRREVTDYDCHGWWEEDGITYMVATLSPSTPPLRPKRHCFVLRDPSIVDSPQWMRLKQSQEGQQMSVHNPHSSAAGQHLHPPSPEDSPSQTSAALFFFNNNNNNNHHQAGKILEMSSFADSCRRNVVVGREGDFASNATKVGHCFASSSSPSMRIRGGFVRGDGWISMKMMTSFTTGILGWILPLTLMLVR